MTHASVEGAAFHAILRDCLREQRLPQEGEIQLIACKIWQDGFAKITNKDWHDLSPGSDEYDYTIKAALMAFGIHTTTSPTIPPSVS